MVVVLLFAMRHSMCGQTTTTNTDCTLNGNTANCTSTSTDNSAAIRAQQEAGAAVGKAMGTAVNGLIVGHRIKSYCKKHPGETWTLSNNNTGEVYNSGQCPESNRQTPQTAQQLASSREQEARSWRTQTRCESEGFIWENGECVARVGAALKGADTAKPSPATQRETFCGKYPRGSFPKPDSGWEYCDVRDDPANHASAAAPAATPAVAKAEPLADTGSSDTVTKAVANIPQSAPVVAPAASPATGTADTPKPCFTDKLGHTVCLAQHPK